MNLKIENLGEVKIINFNEQRFTNLYASEFRDTIEEIINNGGVNLILNLNKVNYMDSSGLGAIISVYNHLNDYNQENETNGKIVVCNLHQPVELLFSMLRAGEFIKIFKDIDSAVDSFTK